MSSTLWKVRPPMMTSGQPVTAVWCFKSKVASELPSTPSVPMSPANALPRTYSPVMAAPVTLPPAGHVGW